MTTEEKLYAAYEFAKTKIHFQPRIALVLGSGLGAFAEKIDIVNGEIEGLS